MENKGYLKTKEAANYLGIHQFTLYRLVRMGKITAYKPSGVLFFSKEDLDSYMKSSIKNAQPA